MEEDEIQIKVGFANVQRGPESVGGKLILTNRRLRFVPHFLNVQSQEDVIDLQDIGSINVASSKLLNMFPIFPNAMLLHAGDGKECRFTVFNRAQWINEINRARKARE